MELKDYNWLIFGAGAVVRNYHMPAFEYLGLLKSITVVDLNKSNLDFIKKTYPQVSTRCSTANDFIDSNIFEKNTLALIALPNNLHKSVAEQLVKKGIYTLCEKPISLIADDIYDLESCVQNENRLISTALVRRFLPSIQALRLAIQGTNILKVEISDGEPFAWLANSPEFFLKSNGGVLADMGIHYLDLIQYLFGEVELIHYSDDCKGGVEANSNCVLRSKDGVDITLKLSRTKFLDNTILVKTSNGDYYVKKNIHSCCYYNDGKLLHNIYASKPFSVEIEPNFESCFVEQLIQFVRNVEIENLNYLSPLTQLNSTKIIHKAYQRKDQVDKTKSKKILITGGSGFIGTELIKSLVNEDFQIVAPMHSYNNCSEIACFDIELPRLELFDDESLNSNLSGVKHIVHLAYSSKNETAYKVNVEGTKNLINAAIRNGVESVVVLSTMYVFGHHNTDKLLDENIGYHPYGGVYAESKLAMEKWCIERSKTSGNTRIVVLNPTCVYGPNGKTYSRLPNDLLMQNKFTWIDNGEGIVNYVFIDNLIDAIKLALITIDAHGKNFIINDGFTTWNDFIKRQLVVKEDQIPSLSSKERNTSAKFNKSMIQVLKSLLMNYDVLELINSNRVLYSMKKVIIKVLPKSKESIQIERTIGASKIKNLNEKLHNPPDWLFELFPNTKTRYSSGKAKKILKWQPRISYEESMNITTNWLKEFYNLK